MGARRFGGLKWCMAALASGLFFLILSGVILIYMVNKELDLLFYALSDNTRREILVALLSGRQSVSELKLPFGISLPAVSKHLSVLERAGLVERSKEGRVHYVELTAAGLQASHEWLERFEQYWVESAEDEGVE